MRQTAGGNVAAGEVEAWEATGIAFLQR